MHHYSSQPPAITHPLVTQLPAGGAQMIPRTVSSVPQMIPGAVSNTSDSTVVEGASSMSDSTSGSASTTPVSDTTATDTDSGDTLPNSIPEVSNKSQTVHCETLEGTMIIDATTNITNTKPVLI